MRLRQVARPIRRGATPSQFNLMLCLLAAIGALTCGGGAHAQSGDFPVTTDEGLFPSFFISPADCDALRTAIADEPTSPFDLVLACSDKRPDSGGKNSPCDLLSGDANVGLPLGQCLDSFPFPLITPVPGQAVLEGGVDMKATAAGQNLALSDGHRVSVTAVQNLAGKVLGTVKVEPGQSACGDECPPAMCGGVKVVQSAEACDEVSAQLRQSVVADTPADPLELSHVLFLDVQATATSSFMTVAICPNHKWTCTDPATPAVPHVDFEGLLSFSIVQGSVCFCTSRLCPYCCATTTKGTIITPCPK